MRHPSLAFAMLALTAGGMPRDESGFDPFASHDPLDPFNPLPPAVTPSSVPCPRCKAGADTPCNPRTLGRYVYHKARVDALAEESDRG